MAINKEVVSSVGIPTVYHRIDAVTFDFEHNQIHVMLKSYANQDYRDMEKNQLSDIETKIERFYALYERANRHGRYDQIQLLDPATLVNENGDQLVYNADGSITNTVSGDTQIPSEPTFLTADECIEFDSLNIYELEARKVAPRFIDVKKYSLELLTDVRTSIYELLDTIPELNGGEMV